MVDVNMSSTPPKVIGKEACLQAKGPFGLSKILDPKGFQTFYRKRSLKK